MQREVSAPVSGAEQGGIVSFLLFSLSCAFFLSFLSFFSSFSRGFVNISNMNQT